MDVRVGSWRKLSTEELMLLNCCAGEDSWESLGLQGDQTSQSWRKSVLNIYWKNWCWSSKTLATDAKNWLIGKDPDAGKDWRQEEKGMTEDEMVGWHHQLNGHESKQALGSLACYSYLYGTWQQGQSSACLGAKSFQSCPTLEGYGILAHQAPLSMGFPRQEHCSGCHAFL